MTGSILYCPLEALVRIFPATVPETKGLEFDCVLLWKPDMKGYKENPKLAKLLYDSILYCPLEALVRIFPANSEISIVFR